MARRRRVRLDPFARPESVISPLTEFVISCGNEVTELEAIREYQNEWCEHPHWRTIVTNYEPTNENHNYFRKCEECGKIEKRSGRSPIAA